MARHPGFVGRLPRSNLLSWLVGICGSNESCGRLSGRGGVAVYGVPADLDLRRFIGSRLIQISLGEFQIQFQFDPAAQIAVEGRWELRDQAGHLVDRAEPAADRNAYRVHRLLGAKVTGSSVAAPEPITLRFDNGHQLQIFDSSREYESFSIQPGDIFV